MLSKLIDRIVSVIYGLFALVALAQVIAWRGLGISIFYALLTVGMSYLALRRWKRRTLVRSDAQHGVIPVGDGEFYSKVLGTSHANADGTNRQQVIRQRCAPGVELQLVREPLNPYDSNAIAVICGGAQIGYLTSELAGEYASGIDAGKRTLTARVAQVTGGDSNKPTLGVNIVVTLQDH